MNKTILITGCSSGFGFLAAQAFARSGYITQATMRDITSESANNLKNLAQNENLNLEVLEIDVTNETTINNAFEYLKSKNELPDVLINNAGYGYLGPVEEASIETIKTQYETNVFGTMRMIQKFLPNMRENKNGLIINISSIVGLVPFPLYGIYSSSKFALESLSEVLNFELMPFNVKVVIVEPGSFATDFGKNRKRNDSVKKESSVYANLEKSFNKRLKEPNQKMAPNQNPKEVVELLLKIVQSESPRLRYLVGKDAKLYSLIKKLIPYSLWKLLLKKAYNQEARIF